MAVLAKTSHSVTDFNDAPTVDLQVTPGQSRVQIFSVDEDSFTTRNWVDAHLVLTPTVNVSNISGNLVDETDTTGNHVSQVNWYYVDTQTRGRVQINETPTPVGLDTGDFIFVSPDDFDTTTNIFGGATQDVARVLEVRKNIVGPTTAASQLQSNNIIRGGVVQIVCEIIYTDCLLYTSPSPRDRQKSRMPSSA